MALILMGAIAQLPVARADSIPQQSSAEKSSAESPAKEKPIIVAELLTKMSTKPHQLNYTGTFTYQHKDNLALQSFRIHHWVDKGVEYERLQHLNGPEREIFRVGNPLGCISLGDKLLQGKIDSINVNTAHPDSVYPLDQLYKFEIRDQERIAGRLATVLLAIPLDAFRYSYFFSIDDETGLVLKSWLVDDQARSLERYQFVDLDLSPDLTALQQQPKARLHKFAKPITSACHGASLAASKQAAPEKWHLRWVPEGFAFAGEQRIRQNMDMLMYTDGLSSFTVFIEPDEGLLPEGVAARGATLAVMSQLQHQQKNFRVTVVGEVPAMTAQKVAQNIEAKLKQ